ncbi:MAG: cytochrome c biogenesis protein CcsA [Nitrospiraceae bacterium]|nr:cytochrome c biogenesis protein CcsA [Nitrospiraceae bacterium]
MSWVESLLAWGMIYAYALSTVLLLTAYVFNKELLLRYVPFLMVPAFIAHTAIFVIRWQRTGYFPANGEFENAVNGGWFAILLTLYVLLRRRGLIGLAMFTVPITLLFLGYGIMKHPTALPHGAALKSSWLIIHVFFAQLAFGAYLVAAGLGAVFLLKKAKADKGLIHPLYEKLPSLGIIDELMFKFVIYGFICDAIMIAAGSIWAKDLWGSYWSWDPVEVWSLSSWLVYGLSIHLRQTLGWRGRRLAWLYIFAMVGIVIAYWGVDFFVKNSQHIFGVKAGS